MKELSVEQLQQIVGGRTECLSGWISISTSLAGGIQSFVY